MGTVAGKRAVAVSLVSTVNVGWSGARLGFSRSCLSWHTFCECVKQRINCGKAEKAATPAEKPGKLVLYSFLPFLLLSNVGLFFFNVNKMKNIIGKIPNRLLKAALVHQLEFSRGLGCPKI